MIRIFFTQKNAFIKCMVMPYALQLGGGPRNQVACRIRSVAATVRASAGEFPSRGAINRDFDTLSLKASQIADAAELRNRFAIISEFYSKESDDGKI